MPSERAPERTVFNPLDPAFHANPYPVYARMRAEDPVHWCALGAGFWAVTRYEDIARLLADGRLGMGAWGETKSRQLGFGAAAETVKHWMLLKDPPDHTRLRRLVSQAFTARAVERMQPRIAAIVDDLLAEPRSRGTIDVMQDLAFPLPVFVIAEMLGVPAEDRHRFHAWTQAINLVFEAFLTPEQTVRCHEAARELGGYLRVLAAERRRVPRDDLMTALIAAQDEKGRLSEEELIGNAGMLLAAGFETTMGLIGNGALALVEHPSELQRLRRDPGLFGNAVEECLRYDSPVQYTGRWALDGLALHGRRVEPGHLVTLFVASANRDASRFAGPDRFDVSRADVGHLSFGGTRHHCLGASLARLECEIALRSLVPLLREAEVAERPLRWRASSLNHVLERLPLRFRST